MGLFPRSGGLKFALFQNSACPGVGKKLNLATRATRDFSFFSD